MGQKVHPVGMRLGIHRKHNSIWYASSKDYARLLRSDLMVRDLIRTRLADAWVSHIQIDRMDKAVCVTIHTARPGIVIGKKGENVDTLRRDISAMVGMQAQLNVDEIRIPELDANLVANSVASQLERRVQFRRAMRRAVQNALRLKAKGIKIRVAGRLGGAEIARCETYHEGRVPLHTLRADIDYAVAEAKTTYGIIGVKVWIFKGEVMPKRRAETSEATQTLLPMSEQNR